MLSDVIPGNEKNISCFSLTLITIIILCSHLDIHSIVDIEWI